MPVQSATLFGRLKGLKGELRSWASNEVVFKLPFGHAPGLDLCSLVFHQYHSFDCPFDDFIRWVVLVVGVSQRLGVMLR